MPDGLSDFAEALANPIKYQSDLEKRAEQLAVLMEDEDITTNSCAKKEMRTLEVIGGSPKHRTSIVAATAISFDTTLDSDHGGDSIGGASSHTIQHQQSLDQSTSTSTRTLTEVTEIVELVAEPLEKILDNKMIKEKRLELEKKLESLRKKHDKEKMRVSAHKSGDLTDGIKKSKFYMNNKLVKRLSNKNM